MINYKELTKLMKVAGWQFDRQARGSNEIWFHPERKQKIPIPNHGSKEIKPTLLEGIMNQAGLK